MRRVTAAQIMSRPVACTRPDAGIQEAIRKMRRLRVSGLPVVDRSGRCVGVITEGDIARMAAGVGGKNALSYVHAPARPREVQKTVGEVMTGRAVTAEEQTPAREIARLMNRHAIKRVPILRKSEIVGIVTRADILALFDRPAGDLASDVRRALREDLLVEAERFDVDVRDGIVRLHGPQASAHEVHLIETILAEIDGVIAVDVSGLRPDTSIPA